jgi:murein DD-endopeptidase MepM/ murein hydrolase activator NlpD
MFMPQATERFQGYNSRAGEDYGTYIEVDHGYGYKTFYAHLDKVLVRKGQEVKSGDVIGLVGNTGASTAPICIMK